MSQTLEGKSGVTLLTEYLHRCLRPLSALAQFVLGLERVGCIRNVLNVELVYNVLIVVFDFSENYQS